MRVKEFIAMLQEADPSGEAFIRLPDGVPVYAELKAGYWDGAYDFIDEDGCFNKSIKEMKVDVYCVDIKEFVLNNYDEKNPNWEEIKSKIKFDYSGYAVASQRQEKIYRWLKIAKDQFDEMNFVYKRRKRNMIAESE